MIDRTPLLNGMSVKQRAEHYDALNAPKQQESTSMTRRRAGYVGMPLERQSEDHKAPTMTRRAKSYDAGQPKEVQNSMKKRGKTYYASVKEEDHLYASNYEFKLEIGGYKIKCKSISNLMYEQELEEVMEGGNNEAPNVFLAPKKKMSTLVLERAFVGNDKVLEAFMPGVRVTNGTIYILRNRKIFREIYFDEGIITKCEFSNLDALGSEVMMHKLEIAHTGLY